MGRACARERATRVRSHADRTVNALSRLRSMNVGEVRFRLACETRKAAGLLRATLAPKKWRRSDLLKALAPIAAGNSASLMAARRALAIGDYPTAHLQFARHFAEREPRFPLDLRMVAQLSDRIRLRFPEAARDAKRRADRMLAGRYDLLGYESVLFGAVPQWHSDPVHGREAPRKFWSAVRYLDPECGDHKVIWEINRHQHWLALARAYHLAEDKRYFRAFVEQLESWMAANPPMHGVNWTSMLELAFRSISWTWALHFFAPAVDDEAQESPWLVDLLVGVDAQLKHIEDNLSRYFSPNTHLLGEALALYAASSALPELRASARRAELGRRVLLDEIDRQIRADGGHAELSPHYHRYTTDFYLLALLIAHAIGDPAAAFFEKAAYRLASYLRTIADDQGRLPLIGDDDGGQLFPICGRRPSDVRDTLAAAAALLGDASLAVSDIPEEVFWLCGGLPIDNLAWRPSPWPSTALPQSGYYVSRTAGGDHLVFDAGPHGFLGAGHAHADALSIVLTVGGRPLLVDGGTATYTMDPALRDRFRTTAMHNTVVINGRSQSEPRGPFHWRSVADARAPVWVSNARFDYVEGHHDGYFPIVHARSVLAVHGFGWIVIDHVLGDGPVTTDAFWHIHPSWVAFPDERVVTVRHRSGTVLSLASSIRLEVLGAAAANGLDAYAPVYGLIERGTCVCGHTEASVPRSFATFITSERAPIASERAPTAQRGGHVVLQQLPLSESLPVGWHGAAFSILAAGRHAIVLAAIERTPTAVAGAPGQFWGCSAARTDARVALTYLGGIDASPIVIHGTKVDHSRASSVPG